MRRRNLSGEERALWGRATKDVRRLARRDERAPIATEPNSRRRGPFPAGLPLGETTREAAFPTRAAPPPPSPLVAGDPALDRRARRGRIGPEATLDLHGMTQTRARAALSRFIERAAGQGLRCVLVVTGKGAPGQESSPYTDRSRRGVLRARFVDWIEEPALRARIARVSQAGPRHGGAGAFYVFLKGRKG